MALVISVLLALWSASSGVQNLIAAVNAAYNEDETRGFVKLKSVSLAFTVGAIVFLVGAFFLIAVLPALLADAGLGTAGRVVAGVLRWVVLLIGMLIALAMLYRYGPDRDEPTWSWVSPGAIVATGLWLAGSALFAFYTANFGKYNETYGSLGAVVVMMLWLYISALAVLLGAELNAELERQTVRDTTKGPPQPMGQRGATAADTLGPTAEEMREESRVGAVRGRPAVRTPAVPRRRRVRPRRGRRLGSGPARAAPHPPGHRPPHGQRPVGGPR